jgi:hypothetical protein
MAQAASQTWNPIGRPQPLRRTALFAAVPAIIGTAGVVAGAVDLRFTLLGAAAVLGWTQLPSI